MGRVEQSIDLRDRHSLLGFAVLDDVVARADFAGLEDAEVEAGAAARRQQRRHPWLVHADPDAIAGHAWLRDLEQRAADAVTVADAHDVVGQPLDGEVFAELPVNEVGPPEPLLPVAIGFDLVNEDRALFTTMPFPISLAVTVQIGPPDAAAAGDGIFPDPGAYRPAIPRDIPGKADVDG